MALKEIDFEHPKGEPGLFGPQSAIWQVHGDFTSMLCGGVSALLLQMLHPLALAGVWDHSNFREYLWPPAPYQPVYFRHHLWYHRRRRTADCKSAGDPPAGQRQG
jgi:uncharacterized protein (DUF2236 family)